MFENVKDRLLSKGIVIENEYLDKYVDLLESSIKHKNII